MISGHDNAKRLKKVERSVDCLVQAHESELKSRLEAIYRYSKELLHDGPDGLTEHDRRDLHQQCRELMELRARWRDGFRSRFRQIDHADAGWLNKVMGRRRTEAALGKSRQEKAEESLNALEIVQLMHFSLMLQMALAGCAGKLEPFRTSTLVDECRLWESLAEFGRKIAGVPGSDEFKNFLAALDDLVVFWSPKQWGESAIDAKRNVETKGNHQRNSLTVCPHCGTKNRVPTASPSGQRVICGRCKSPLLHEGVPNSVILESPGVRCN